LESSDPALSVYLHVPFCTDKCLYCDFYSVPRGTVAEALQKDVVDQTILQARHFLDQLRPARIDTLFIGGGTPSALTRTHLAALLDSCRGTGCVEWTVEANPESLDRSFLALCETAGVTRLSVGVQSMRDGHLRLLKRPATRDDNLEALHLIREQWHGELNLDFIAGIPGQTPAEVREDLALLDDFRPCHVSLYQLTCEPETELSRLVGNGTIVLNSRERDEELWFAGKEELEGRGYRNYEISNFCRPGKECRHNLRYWRMEPYLGVGPGAVSTVPARSFAIALRRGDLAEKPGCVLRVSNPRDIGAFLVGKDGLWGLGVDVVESKDFLFENLMMGLRLAEGIPLTRWESRFGRRFEEFFPGIWERWTGEGLAEQPRANMRLTESGRLVLDRLLGEIAERIASPDMAPPSVSWP
jgi:oxygen-independent coproporphyrinogen III oxidase